MVVAPKLDHGMVGKFECRDGYMLKGHNTTQCFFGNWTGMTPWCKEGKISIFLNYFYKVIQLSIYLKRDTTYILNLFIMLIFSILSVPWVR